jgi:hypothetical protein
MIYYYANGELGNQLFQYHFVCKCAEKNERIIICGIDQLLYYYDVQYKVFHIPKKSKLLRLIGYIINYFLYFVAKYRIISFIYPEKIKYNVDGKEYIKDGSTINYQKGFLKKIKYIKSSNYSSDSLLDAEFKL